MELSTQPIARYQYQFQVTEEILLPEYAGSALRGAFGRALRRISCMTKQKDCKDCPLYRTCPYTNIFETPAPTQHQLQKFSQVPNGYIIEPPKWGEQDYLKGSTLSFELVLFGRLIHQLPLITFAFQRALEYNLAGGKAKLTDVRYCPEQLSKNPQNLTACNSILNKDKLIDHTAQLSLPSNLPDYVVLNLETPLRLQEKGNPLDEHQISAQRLLLNLAKRFSLLSEFHFQPINLDFEQLKQEIAQVEEHKQLYWQDWTRYSSRQQQKMKLGGVMGEWQIRNLSPRLAQLLYLGQWLHCGKNATFGLGKYQITNL